jgi:predicted transcriptional regulator YheO
LGATLGRDYEIILHDVSAEPPFIVTMENGELTGRDAEAPMTDFGRYLMTAPEAREWKFIPNYSSRTADGRTLRSGVALIRDEKGDLIGFLCINYDTTRAEVLRDMAEFLASANPLAAPGVQAEHFAPAGDRLEELLAEARRTCGKPLRYAGREERIRTLEWLDAQGYFGLKEAIPRLSRETGKSRFTLYGDLRRLREKRDDDPEESQEKGPP